VQCSEAQRCSLTNMVGKMSIVLVGSISFLLLSRFVLVNKFVLVVDGVVVERLTALYSKQANTVVPAAKATVIEEQKAAPPYSTQDPNVAKPEMYVFGNTFGASFMIWLTSISVYQQHPQPTYASEPIRHYLSRQAPRGTRMGVLSVLPPDCED